MNNDTIFIQVFNLNYQNLVIQIHVIVNTGCIHDHAHYFSERTNLQRYTGDKV